MRSASDKHHLGRLSLRSSSMWLVLFESIRKTLFLPLESYMRTFEVRNCELPFIRLGSLVVVLRLDCASHLTYVYILRGLVWIRFVLEFG